MKFFKYIENSFEEARLEQSKSELAGKYSLWKDAECKALNKIVGWNRSFFIFLHIPLTFLRYPLVVIGLLKQPEPVIQMQIKADEQAKRVAAKIAKEAIEFAKKTPPENPPLEP